MCDPATATMVLTAGGTLFSAHQAMEQADYQEQVAKNNAITQERMAKDAEARGRIEEANHRLKVAQMKSSQRARQGATGAEVNTGSAALLQQDTAEMGELDALTIRSNARRESWGYRVGATNSRAQGKLDKMRGRSNAAGTLLTGGSQVAGQWYNYNQGR